MSNIEIIQTEAMLAGLQGKKLYTYKEWKNRGFQVQKGEKATLKTKLWKQVIKKDKEGNEEKKFYLVKANLFSEDQVKLIQQKEKIA